MTFQYNNDVDEFLEHFGVRGMKWGVRRDRDGVSRKTDREARKDAEEFARAKLFYGQGAGNRRKLINNSVEAKKKRDPDYARAFDKHLASQDLSQHASKARSERSRIDRKDKTKKSAGFLARRFTGEMGTTAAFTAVALAGATYLASPQGRRHLDKGVNAAKNFARGPQADAAQKYVADFLKRQG